jgi:hypothetical protein
MHYFGPKRFYSLYRYKLEQEETNIISEQILPDAKSKRFT